MKPTSNQCIFILLSSLNIIILPIECNPHKTNTSFTVRQQRTKRNVFPSDITKAPSICFQGSIICNNSIKQNSNSFIQKRNNNDRIRNYNTNMFHPPIHYHHPFTNPSSSCTTYYTHPRRIKPLQMSLLPIPVNSLEKILTSQLPTPAQYASYWGRTSREQYNTGFEAFSVAFLGVFAAYFLSFAIGQFVATILGMIAASWFLLGPELKAYQRNWELTGGRELVDPWITDDDDDYYHDDDYELDEDNRGLYGAFYLGRIEHVCVVDYPTDLPEDEYSLDEFQDYTMENDEQERQIGIPYSLRLRVTDSTDYDDGRELQIHTRMSEEYLDLEVGMPVCTVLLSTSQKFQSLSAITDFCVPDAGPCWVGDYPYLDRPALEELLANDDELWDCLREEGRGDWDVAKLED